MRRRRILSLLWGVVFAVTLLTGAAGPGRAQGGVTLTLFPAEVGVAETAVVEGRIACPAGSCMSFDLVLRFDRSIVRVWDAAIGPYLGTQVFERQKLVDNAAGEVRLSFEAMGTPPGTDDLLFSLQVGGLIPGTAAFNVESLQIADANGILLAATGQGTQVTVFETGKIAFFSPPVNEWEVAFTSERDGNPEIYVIKGDGTNPRRLTDESALDGSPAWSPDGSRLAFHSARDGNLEIYLMNPDGSGVQRLTDHPASDSDPAWSPDGTRLAFVSDRDGNPEIYVMNADGSNVQRLTNDPSTDTQPVWSPDGRQIAFVTARAGVAEVYIMNADGSSPRRLTPDLFGANGWYPAWSPNGLLLTFISERDGQADIYRMTKEATDIRRLTPESDRLTSTDWSPDGGWIALMSGRSGYANLYVMDAEGRYLFRLTDEESENYDPDWRPVFQPLPAVCKVRTQWELFARVRVGPGVNRSAFAFLPANQDFTVEGQALDSEGKVWWKLDKNEIPGGEMALSLWVAEEDVEEIGNCLGVPQAEIPPIIPGGPPPGQPGGGPTPPPGWGPCGSCSTCGGPASECVTSPTGECLWDPKTCAPPPPVITPQDGGQCYTLTVQVVQPAGIPSCGSYAGPRPGPNCDGGFTPGSTTSLNAQVIQPELCYFVGWSGCGVSTSNEFVEVTMNSSCTLTATFAAWKIR